MSTESELPGSGESMDASVPELLLPLWRQRRADILARIALVESALHDDGTVSMADGLTEAHKLHGLLGTFGFNTGSEIAGRAEDLLGTGDPARGGWIDVASELSSLRRALTTASEEGHSPK